MNNRYRVLLCLFVLLSSTLLFSQKTIVYDNPMQDYNLALELFNKGKYGAARKLFNKTIERIDDRESVIRINSEYYEAISAFHLFNPDTEKLLTAFIHNYPTHSLQSKASFQMGNLQYRNREYEEALHWYARADLFDLNSEQRVELTFKTGYSHFMNEDYDRAKQYFFDIKDPSSVYYSPASYYYGHISYLEGNYETALIYFDKLTEDQNFGPIVPYYITHIYFLQGEYDKVIAFAPPLLEEASTRRAAEIARMIGESYYNKSQFEEAIPFLEQFHAETRQRASREDHYQMGFAYYRAGQFANAVKSFENVSHAEDSLYQNALYHLADAYLQTDQRRSARNAFMSAHQMDIIEEITQDALFNYAKLSFELSMNPYNEAIISFQRYVEEYPDSPRANEAYRHLIDLYLTTRNYNDALTSMEAIALNTPELRAAYQRIAYYRGIELFNNGDFQGAIGTFEKSLQYPENRTIRAQSVFWKGEAFFRLEEYTASIETLRQFQQLPGAFSLPEYNKANYTTGYAHFKLENYPPAITAFRKFTQGEDIPIALFNDAYLRIADSYFITNQYASAIDFYERAIALESRDVDYAMFQKAVALGVRGKFQGKINALLDLLRKYPRTGYADNAHYEIGNTYVIQDNPTQALIYYNELINNYPNSSYVKSAMLKTGLVYYGLNEDDRALQMFRQIVETYPGTAEAQEALGSMRNIYVAMDQVEAFFAFAESVGFGDVTVSQQDSLTYIAAENRYMQGDCENAAKSFENYLERFPNGIFSLNAHFYKAECNYRFNQYARALSSYQYVLEKPRSRFSENAALRAAQINFSLNQFQAALDNFSLLEELAESSNNRTEARIGQMRSLHKLDRYDDIIEAANRVLDDERISREVQQEAYLLTARASMGMNDRVMAKEYFEKTNNVAENSMAAEAKYYLAYFAFREGEYEKTENLIFEYIDFLSSYDYWLAKIFILLADNYIVQENIFQARHTLRSIIDNYDGEDLVTQARDKLAALEREEELRQQEGAPDTLEVDFSSTQSTERDVF